MCDRLNQEGLCGDRTRDLAVPRSTATPTWLSLRYQACRIDGSRHEHREWNSGLRAGSTPNGAYSTGFKPITHQEFLRSIKARRRYWARSYGGWRRFNAAQPSTGHIALSSLEKAGHISFMITQNVDRRLQVQAVETSSCRNARSLWLHHRAGSNPLELHGTVYTVACTKCDFTLPRDLFQDQVKAHNPKWAAAIDSRSDKSFGMKQRPDGDIEIDEKFWEEDFFIPDCQRCQGVLKPDFIQLYDADTSKIAQFWILEYPCSVVPDSEQCLPKGTSTPKSNPSAALVVPNSPLDPIALIWRITEASILVSKGFIHFMDENEHLKGQLDAQEKEIQHLKGLVQQKETQLQQADDLPAIKAELDKMNDLELAIEENKVLDKKNEELYDNVQVLTLELDDRKDSFNDKIDRLNADLAEINVK
ncbi:hypothetical protein RND71_010804 [Anisodus tanguticus]|uniref:Deacetylase sirtuin-type domain-containing protein n=1 Tax=Anisodus tanguticus TaxID=243964 RepID=A0AAE1SKG6_9SOLA|nr:hypothetical protein RND71_010804 [Anisodus tanguticus]